MMAPNIIDAEAPSTSSQGTGLRVTFADLTYVVKDSSNKRNKLSLLNNVSGFLEPGELTALLGPSGSGKTTLLDLLAGRKNVGNISGTIRYGGVTPSPAYLQRYTGYVEQFDTLISTLTVNEMLMYTAELKRPLSEARSSKQEAVSRLLTRLGLDTCAHVPIGSALAKGISGGQAKRTNIGIALISDPRVLYLDEPTSGLDSWSAHEIMQLVKGVAADSGTTVCATIHSPSSDTFALFDRVLMMVRGRVVYFGPQGLPAVSYAKEFWAMADPRKADHSAAEYLVDAVTQADRQGKGGLLADIYSTSQLKRDNDAQLAGYMLNAAPDAAKQRGKACCTRKLLAGNSQAELAAAQGAIVITVDASIADDDASSSTHTADAVQQHSPAHSTDCSGSNAGTASNLTEASNGIDAQLAKELAVRSSTTTPWWWALFILLKYRSTVNYKNPAWVGPRVGDKFLFAFIILTLYLRSGDRFETDNLVNMAASLFMWTTLPAYGAVAYVPSIVLERGLFYRERADGLYSVGTYLLAKLVEELGLATIISVLFSVAIFFGVQYQGSFALFWLVYLLTLANGIALGYLVAALAPTMDVANAATPAYVTTLLFFAGQLATPSSIPSYWQWYSRIDFVRYSWGALMVNQFENNDLVFTADGTTILDYYSFKHISKWGHTALMLAFFAAFTALAYLTLCFVKHSKR